MGLETATYVKDLVPANPPATDLVAQGDDHIRLVKQALQNTFPSLTGPTLPTSTGTANAQAVTHLFAPTSYQAGQEVVFIAGFTNTGPMTLNVNGVGARNLFVSNAPAVSGAIATGALVFAIYDGVQFQTISASSGVFLPLVGGTLTGNLTVAPASGGATLTAVSATAGAALVLTKSGTGFGNFINGNTGANIRWQMVLGNTTAEGGSNAGSDFTLSRFSDAGGGLGTPLSINRANGAISINNSLAIAGGATVDTLNVTAAYGLQCVPAAGQEAAIRFVGARTWYQGCFTDGHYRIVDQTAAAERFGINSAGVANFASQVTVGTDLIATGGVYAANTTAFGLLQISTTRYFQFGGGTWCFTWNTSTGAFAWNTPNGALWNSRTSDNLSWNAVGTVGGNGAYSNISDIRTKRDIEAMPYGLAEILALEPIRFTRIPHGSNSARPPELGFTAQAVRPLIPEAVVEIGTALPDGSGEDSEAPSLALYESAILAVAVNAIKELAEAIKELTARVAVLEAKGG